MRNLLENPPLEKALADYNIYFFTDGIYKVINFKHPGRTFLPPVRSTECKYDNKLSQSLSRSRRRVLELALCNDWFYFCTFTLDPMKYDRFDLPKFYKDFTQWIRDLRKKYKKEGLDFQFNYLLVPEEHKNGAWHMHGLFSDIGDLAVPFSEEYINNHNLPYDLINNGYFNFPAYQEKFGFCSLGKIKNRVATGFYISKYILKQMDCNSLPVGSHSYYANIGLKTPVLHGDVYGYSAFLNNFLTHDYEFVRTGFTHLKDGLSWDFALEYMDFSFFEPLDISTTVEKEVDDYVEVVQTAISDFLE